MLPRLLTFCLMCAVGCVCGVCGCVKDGCLYVYEGDFLVAGTVGPLCPAAVFAGLKGERVPFAALALSPLMPWLFFARADSKEIYGWSPLPRSRFVYDTHNRTRTHAHHRAPPHTHTQ